MVHFSIDSLVAYETVALVPFFLTARNYIHCAKTVHRKQLFSYIVHSVHDLFVHKKLPKKLLNFILVPLLFSSAIQYVFFSFADAEISP